MQNQPFKSSTPAESEEQMKYKNQNEELPSSKRKIEKGDFPPFCFKQAPYR
jgi:hypothetical protein